VLRSILSLGLVSLNHFVEEGVVIVRFNLALLCLGLRLGLFFGLGLGFEFFWFFVIYGLPLLFIFSLAFLLGGCHYYFLR
jgi:hypothetical protein